MQKALGLLDRLGVKKSAFLKRLLVLGRDPPKRSICLCAVLPVVWRTDATNRARANASPHRRSPEYSRLSSIMLATISLLTSAYSGPDAPTAAASGRNVLYIVYDDLRPESSAYGQSHMSTPAMQRLADTGTTFERAYCQEAVCSPSRNSFSTGRRPNSTKVWNFINVRLIASKHAPLEARLA